MLPDPIPSPENPDPIARKHRFILIVITATLVLLPLILGTLRLLGWI